MKVKEFNLLNQSGKRQTKVIVAYENDLFKVGRTYTVKEIHEYMMESIDQLTPYNPRQTKLEAKKRYAFIDGYEQKIINSLEMKNR